MDSPDLQKRWDQISTKCGISRLGSVMFAALSFAPLEYSEHSEYQIQIEQTDGEWHFTPHANLYGTPSQWKKEMMSNSGRQTLIHIWYSNRRRGLRGFSDLQMGWFQ